MLEDWRQQIIEARILKAENQIPDQPDEIELEIADIERVVSEILAEESLIRSERVQDHGHSKSEPSPPIPEIEQLSLF